MSDGGGDLAGLIRGRRTEKVLGDVDHPAPVSSRLAEERRSQILDAIRTAGWAPFHYARDVDGIAEPWRVHYLSHELCHRLAVELRDDFKVMSKEPRLLAGCGAMVLVTWLPEADMDGAANQAAKARDEEHLAAASAMVQNLLLLLTEMGLGSYWSSGGILREPSMFKRLGIPEREKLLAAVFVEFPEARAPGAERKPGGQRPRRGEGWLRELS